MMVPSASELHPALGRPLVGFAITLIALISFLWPASSLDAQPPGGGSAAPVIAAPVIAAPIIERQVASGQTYVASVTPLKRAMIGSAVEGRVIEIFADEGERVKARQPLAQLLTTTIELELQVAEAELALRSAELEELTNGMLPDEIEQARAKMQAAKANFEFSRSGFDRMKSLLTRQAVSQEDYDSALATLNASEQSFYDYKAAHDMAIAGPRAERIVQAQARVASQEATNDLIRDRIAKYTISSTFDGFVVAKFTESGAWVGSGDPVMEIVALDEVEVKAYVSEQHIPFVRLGMEVRVEIPAIPDRIFTGFVSAVIPQADSRARTFPVNVRVKNELDGDGPLLKSGMYARVELPTGKVKNSQLVPKDAIVLGGPTPIIFVVDNSDATGQANDSRKVRPIAVQLGVASGEWISVIGNLNTGDLVVVEGNERLRADQAVNVTSTRTPPPVDSLP